MANIYISSTYEDLKKEREAAVKAVRRSGHIDIAMENDVAADKRPVDKCREDVRNCDVYIGIFAWRYGFIPDGYDKSITHLEYEEAKKAGKECLIFLLGAKAPWPVEKVDKGEAGEKIDRLRSQLQENHTVSFFNDGGELSGLISPALSRLLSDTQRSLSHPVSQWRMEEDFKRPEDLIGKRFGKYVIKEKLGRGGKGVVFRVMDTLEEIPKAAKLVPPQIADSPVAFKELKREVNNASRISHPNVVKVLGLEEQEGQYFIVMEYIEGRSLEQMLADSKEGKLSETDVIYLMKELARGLHETHKNRVIHRDVKPSNIMVTGDREVKILDFGISYQVTKSMTQLVGDRHKTGTWPYMAPEQLSTGYGRENEQVDIWGLGVTMYQLLTGQFPFKHKDQIKDRHEKPYELEGVSKKVRCIVMKCLAKDRKKRYKNMEEVLGALKNVSKKKVKVKEKEPPNRKWILAAAAIIVLVAIGILFKNQFLKENSSPRADTKAAETEVVNEGHDPGKKENDALKEKLEEEFKEYLKQVRSHLKNRDPAKARQNLELAKKIKETKETSGLENQIIDLEKKEKEFAKYYAEANDYFSKGKYNTALESINNAKKIKKTREIKKLEKKILEKIEEQKKLEALEKDDRAFEAASAKDTISSYEAYIETYPNGRHMAEAGERIKELKKIPEDVRNIRAKIGKEKVLKNKKGYWEADYGDGIIMVYIPEGEFNMGSDGYDREKPIHTVYLDGYWLGKYEVTFAQYDKYCEGAKKDKPDDKKWGRGKRPVINVSWEDANAYCKWLSKKKGLNFKLPTEAQWEKAARGTDSRKYPWGDSPPSGERVNFADKQKWLKEKDSWAAKDIDDGYAYTAPVGSYPQGASPYGLLDMVGNVWEWCNDWYGKYSAEPQKNPTGPESGSNRVVRGGSWVFYARDLRCAFRVGVGPSFRYYNHGFRLCQDNR